VRLYRAVNGFGSTFFHKKVEERKRVLPLVGLCGRLARGETNKLRSVTAGIYRLYAGNKWTATIKA
jgi:hypothetical protein